ncbi:CoA ester lyase [uncultured Aquincola sp.]|uniref:HpcH/HpaI aldolase/citrate lyase family protein n=1 Tax=uncultured Aquincola sp. TaxID=886556 RepID=UPI0032B28D16|tara:strand:- start:5090 stop:5920 length:831 start_codon:yes stop_codon:yes gene_type:complete
MNAAQQPRAMLFVSGEKPDRFDKALAAGADLVCIDLEDAVAPRAKAQARAAVLQWLQARRPAGIALRVNGVRTLEGLRDLLALVEADVRLDWLLLPKVESADELQLVQAWTGERCPRLAALLETPVAIEQAGRIAAAGGRLGALMLGGADLAAELGAQFGWDGLLHARGRLVNAARAGGLQAWDVPYIALDDEAGLAEETRRVAALGFDCKTAIHPRQLPVVHAALQPSAAEAEWAAALLADLPEGATPGAYLFRGRMVDAPVLAKARRIAARIQA